jgi:hypothetical protein
VKGEGYNVGNPYKNGFGRPRNNKKRKGTKITYEDKAQELRSRGWWLDDATDEWCRGDKEKPERCQNIDEAYRTEFGTDPDE